jgi:hypothetical protein
MMGPPSPASQWFYDELDDMYEGSKKLLPKPEDDSWPEDWSPYYIPGHGPGRSHVWCSTRKRDELDYCLGTAINTTRALAECITAQDGIKIG